VTRNLSRRTHAVALEWHVSGLKLVAAAMLVGAAGELNDASGRLDRLVPAALAAAGAAAASGLVPWVWPRVPLAAERALAWTATGLATAAALTGLAALGVRALLGAQLLLAAAVLAELRGRRSILAPFWASVLVVAATIALYYLLVPLRPVAD